MVRQRKKHHFWRNLLILIVLFGIYLYWGNRSIETDEATFTSAELPAGFDGCRIVLLTNELHDLLCCFSHCNIPPRFFGKFSAQPCRDRPPR